VLEELAVVCVELDVEVELVADVELDVLGVELVAEVEVVVAGVEVLVVDEVEGVVVDVRLEELEELEL
jgi:hypothetical protein